MGFRDVQDSYTTMWEWLKARAAGASAHGPRHGLRRVLSAMFAARASPPGSVRAQLQQRMAKGRHDAVAVL